MNIDKAVAYARRLIDIPAEIADANRDIIKEALEALVAEIPKAGSDWRHHQAIHRNDEGDTATIAKVFSILDQADESRELLTSISTQDLRKLLEMAEGVSESRPRSRGKNRKLDPKRESVLISNANQYLSEHPPGFAPEARKAIRGLLEVIGGEPRGDVEKRQQGPEIPGSLESVVRFAEEWAAGREAIYGSVEVAALELALRNHRRIERLEEAGGLSP